MKVEKQDITPKVVQPPKEYQFVLTLSPREFALLKEHYGNNPCGRTIERGYTDSEIMSLHRALQAVE